MVSCSLQLERRGRVGFEDSFDSFGDMRFRLCSLPHQFQLRHDESGWRMGT